MPVSHDLTDFVRRALNAGQKRTNIRNALSKSGWETSEVDAALASWDDNAITGPVPRPVRSGAAREALFYALLFIAFGMVACNAMILAFGQIDLWFPDDSQRYSNHGVRTQRWSMAALIVFIPVFLALDRRDKRAVTENPAHEHGTIRRWISAIALLVAVTTLLGDALYVIFRFLNGDLTIRFLARSGIIACIATIVLAYFRNHSVKTHAMQVLGSAWTLGTLGVSMLILALAGFGGPSQGQTEQRDKQRIKDMRTLSSNIRSCRDIDRDNLPETLNPLDCAVNLDRLTAFASQVSYKRLSNKSFELCTKVEFPPAVTSGDITVRGGIACIETKAK